MPVTNISPNSIISIGEYSVTDAEVVDILSDGSEAVDSADVFNNTIGNQLIRVGLEDVSDNSNFTSFTTTIHARRGGKGTATVNIRVVTSGGDLLSSHNIIVNTANISVYTTPSTSVSFNTSVANGLELRIQGTGNTQCFYTEAFVTLTSTITSAGKIIIPAIGGLVNITEGKIIL
tara:strand:+ start:865 stop:1392 length:528 start_codon:yes stop_codon:yes gene_type:complete